ncbi:MAG: enoyl-ACP reductase FabV [Planctomycetota bacterium]|jgi:enoyl-[acyl-carrier protein] reductase/trans-2-enoyl-CoA reductase (NAD+)
MSEQVIKPRFRGFICTSAHPEGCAANVREQVEVVKAGSPGSGLGNVLIIGSSTGYGLASLLTSVFGYGADAMTVCFEKPSDGRRPASAGWYNLAEAHRLAKEAGRRVETVNGDAFSHEIKAEVISALKERFGKVDQVIYSLASPKRKDPDSDTVWSSVLKPIGSDYASKSVDLRDETIIEASFTAATEQEQADTVKVMGGEDWKLWIDALREADLLADGCRTVAYSYIGPQVTFPIYRSGTIGGAKEHLEASAKDIEASLSDISGQAWVSVNKALVTQASAAIPVVPLYISLLFKVMKEAGNHEGTIEQIVRLYKDHLGPGATPSVDEVGRIRIDDWELDPAIQAQTDALWEQVTSDNFRDISDFAGFQRDFRQLFGFEVEGIDYEAATEVERPLA